MLGALDTVPAHKGQWGGSSTRVITTDCGGCYNWGDTDYNGHMGGHLTEFFEKLGMVPINHFYMALCLNQPLAKVLMSQPLYKFLKPQELMSVWVYIYQYLLLEIKTEN